MSDKAIRALLDVMDEIPVSRFGKGKARRLRKAVLLAIASSADADGTNAYPGLETLARRCLASERAVRTVIDWWVRRGLLKVEYKASRLGTNTYVILLEEAKKEVPKRTRTRKAMPKPKDPEARLPGEDVEARLPGDVEVFEDRPGSVENIPGSLEHVPGSVDNRPGSLTSTNRPTNRPILPPSIDRSFNIPPIQPSCGWLAGFVSSTIKKFTDRPCPLSADEVRGLKSLAAKHGELKVALAVWHFAEDRRQGLDGLAWPVKMFFKEADDWISYAVQEADIDLAGILALNPNRVPDSEIDAVLECIGEAFPRELIAKMIIRMDWEEAPQWLWRTLLRENPDTACERFEREGLLLLSLEEKKQELEEETSAAIARSKTSQSEVKQLTCYVIQYALNLSDGKGIFHDKDEQKIADCIRASRESSGGTHPLREDLEQILGDLISGWDDFALKRAGSALATLLGPAIIAQRDKIAEQADRASVGVGHAAALGIFKDDWLFYFFRVGRAMRPATDISRSRLSLFIRERKLRKRCSALAFRPEFPHNLSSFKRGSCGGFAGLFPS